jgi:hypothetical protein
MAVAFLWKIAPILMAAAPGSVSLLKSSKILPDKREAMECAGAATALFYKFLDAQFPCKTL